MLARVSCTRVSCGFDLLHFFTHSYDYYYLLLFVVVICMIMLLLLLLFVVEEVEGGERLKMINTPRRAAQQTRQRLLCR